MLCDFVKRWIQRQSFFKKLMKLWQGFWKVPSDQRAILPTIKFSENFWVFSAVNCGQGSAHVFNSLKSKWRSVGPMRPENVPLSNLKKSEKGPWWPIGGAGCQKSVFVTFGCPWQGISVQGQMARPSLSNQAWSLGYTNTQLCASLEQNHAIIYSVSSSQLAAGWPTSQHNRCVSSSFFPINDQHW